MLLKAIIMCSMILSQAHADTNPTVIFKTNKGDFTVTLDQKNAPKTVENFLHYVEDGFYTDTIFHRVIDGFMVQGGGFTTDMTQKETKDPIVLESSNGLKNDAYTIAMARTNDPNSATAQFFINVQQNNFLNHNATNPTPNGYAVFGKVTSGTDVIDAIKVTRTSSNHGFQDVPIEEVIILSATRVAC
jgi:peptidyl-prolyl cis-trans isomerase B (cyclophilin B)